jgi:nicotinamidase/pyrazinamidase
MIVAGPRGERNGDSDGHLNDGDDDAGEDGAKARGDGDGGGGGVRCLSMTLGILLVDPQYDFFPGGALAVARGDEIVAPINALLRQHPDAPVFASRDWHPTSTRHFRERGGIWPPHCVEGTRGAAFHDGLEMGRALVYDKGTDPEDDGGYSAFDGRRRSEQASHALIDDLRARGVDALIVAGLATDYCVKASVLDARKHGLVTFLFLPGARAVELKDGDGERACTAMREAGALLVA